MTRFPRLASFMSLLAVVVPVVGQAPVAGNAYGPKAPAAGGMVSMGLFGGEEQWKAGACAGTASCFVQFGPADRVDGGLGPRMGGGASTYGYVGVTSRSASVAGIGALGGGLSLTSQNGYFGSLGYGLFMGVTATHRMSQEVAPFVLRYSQMYGDNTHYVQNYPITNRDNTVLLNLVSDMAGGQLGGSLGLTSHHYGNGDTIGVVSDLRGWGINMGDEEGTSLMRGNLGPVVDRYRTSLTGVPSRNLTTGVFDLPVAANNVNFLGIHNFVLNTTNAVSLNVAHLNSCTAMYGMCAVTDHPGEVVQRYGTTRFQAIRVDSTGMLTVEAMPDVSETVQVNGRSFRFVERPATDGDVAIGEVPDVAAANLAEAVRKALPGVTFKQNGPDLIFTAAGVSLAGSQHVRWGGAGGVPAVSASEFLPAPKLVPVTVKDASACKLHATAVLFDALVYQLVTIAAVNSPTSVTLASFDNYSNGATLACGGTAGYAFTFDADVIAPEDMDRQYGSPRGNATIYNRMHPSVGNREDGTIVLWSSMTPDYSSRALARNAPSGVPVITLTTKDGTVTGGTIQQKGNEYENRSDPDAGAGLSWYSTQALYLPQPEVTFSRGCTAAAHVQYWTRENKLLLGVPDMANGGGRSEITVDKPGSGCQGATATLTSVYPNTGKLMPLAILEAFRWKDTSPSFTPDPGRLIVNLVSPGDWRTGDVVSNEIGAHTKTNLTSGVHVYDYADGGNNQQLGSSARFTFAGVTPAKFLWSVENLDNPALFAEPNTVATTSEHFKSPPDGLKVAGAFATTLQLSAPVGWGYSGQGSGGATLIRVDTAGHSAAANQVAYNLFTLPDMHGWPVSMIFNPTTRVIRYPLLEADMIALKGTGESAGLLLDARQSAPGKPVAGAMYFDAKADRPAACGAAGCGDLAMRGEAMRFVGTVKTTAAAADSLNVPGLTGGHCNAQQIWDGASQPMNAMVEVSAEKVVLHHPAVAGAVFDISCVGL